MDQASHVKLKFNYQEYQNLLTEFNTQQKQGKYKPLPYNDYRLIAGKFFTNPISEVVIERVDVNNFIIVFLPTATTIYAGKMDDNSFGSFIHNYIKENQKETMTNNSYNVKNNTYDIWGDKVKYNESAVINSAASASVCSSDGVYSTAGDYSNYSNTVTLIDSSRVYDLHKELEKRVQGLAEESACAQADLKDIHRKLDELLDMITHGRYFNEYQFDTIHNDIDSIVSRVEEIENKFKVEDKRKDNEKTMNTNKMFNFDFGVVDSNIRMSPYGMAIRNADGRYVSYDVKSGSVIDVEPFNFEGNRFMMKMPVAVKDVAVGDIVIHNHKPMFVVNTNDKVTVIDIYNGEEKNILLTKNMFGFDFVTKVVSFINFSGASAENPFGNMWPLFMLSDSNSGFDLNGATAQDPKNMLMLMAIMGQMSGAPANMFQNPMFMMAFLNDGKSDMKDFLMFMAMTSAMNNTQVPVMMPNINVSGVANGTSTTN